MTSTDTNFIARFPNIDINTFVGNQTDLPNFEPTTNTFNVGMLSDIGRALIYAPDTQDSFYARFLQPPLSRGDAVLSARFGEIASRAFDPLASVDAWFDGSRPEMVSNVAKKNLSRQIRLEVNDYWTRQFCQTDEMISDAMSAIMATQTACYRDDMWIASKEYFSGSVRGAKSTQMVTMSKKSTDVGFGDELNETLYRVMKGFKYKSTDYNASGYNTKTENPFIALTKDCEYPGFKRFLSETYNPSFVEQVSKGISYVDDFATPAGAPADAGALVGVVVDPRAYKITPLPDAVSTEATRLSPRKSTLYTTTYEYVFEHDPFFNVVYIFAPKE